MITRAKEQIGKFGITLLAIAFAMSMLPALSAPPAASANALSVGNPRVAANESTSEYSSTWDCLWFGSYPQSEVLATDPIYAKMASADWDEDGDAWIGAYKYRRILPDDATSSSTWPEGFTGYRYFKWEPIKWRVLNVSDGEALLVADAALDCRQYLLADYAVSWDISTLRTWLNGYGPSANTLYWNCKDKGFINYAFSEDERTSIITTFRSNTVNQNPSYKTFGGETNDKVFLLGAYDVCSDATKAPSYGFSKYEASSATRRCKPTDFANAMGAPRSTGDDYNGECAWWLCTPGSPSEGNMSNKAVYVNTLGGLPGLRSMNVTATRGIRPALTLDLSVARPSYAGTVSSGGSVSETPAAGSHGNRGSFMLGRDNNSFAHHNDASVKPAAGFLGVKNNSVDYAYLNELLKYADKGERSAIKEAMYGSWGGSCYGIASSMAMLFEGYASPSDLATTQAPSYYDLSYPCYDKAFLNNIKYYQLSQKIDNGAKLLSRTTRETIMNQVFDVHYDGDTLQEFLEKLVTGYREHHTLIFCYSYVVKDKGIGHAVLITGCNYNSSEERYELEVYDENCIVDKGDEGGFGTMYIPDDYSSFTYVNHAGDTALASNLSLGDMVGTGFNLSNVHVYNQMSIVDPANIAYLVPHPEQWTTENLFPSLFEADETGKVRISIPMGMELTISTQDGKKLTHKDGEFSGDMSVYDIDFECASDAVGGGFYTVEVDPSETFEMSDISGEADIDIYDDENYLSVSGSGITGTSMTLGQGCVIRGTDYSFKAFASTPEEIRAGESGLISMSGQATGDVTISSVKDTVTATSDEDMQSVVTASYAGANRKENTVGTTKVAEMRAERVVVPTKPAANEPAGGASGSTAAGPNGTGGLDATTDVQVGSSYVAGSGAKAAYYKVKQAASANAAGSVWYAKPKTPKKVKSLSIPATITIDGLKYNVTGIEAKALSKCTKLTKATIGNEVVTISANAFNGAKNLKALTLGTQVKTVGKNAFKGCKKLKKVTVKSAKLSKASCKNLVKGTKIAKVVLKANAKAAKAKKAYKKRFPKKNAGKKLKIS